MSYELNIISKFIISILFNTYVQRKRKPDWRLPKLFYKKCPNEKFPKLYWHFNMAVKSVATHFTKSTIITLNYANSMEIRISL